MENIKLMLRLDQRIDYLIGQTFCEFGVEVKRPTIDFNLRGTAAGMVNVYANRMSLNPILLFENPDEFIEKTSGHEFCHLAVPRLLKGRMPQYNHGRQWQMMMRTLKVPIEIDHRYNVSTITGRTPKAARAARVPHDERCIYQEYINRVTLG